MNGNHRRDFLRNGLVLGGAAAAFGGTSVMSRLSRAAELPEASADAQSRRFIFVYFSGGWDLLLGVDPRDPGEFSLSRVSETRLWPAYELLNEVDPQNVDLGQNATFGPFFGDLGNHFDKLTVVRGVSPETLSHDAGRLRHNTGKPPSGLQARGSSVATWLAASMGANEPVPNLSVRVASFNRDQPNYASGLRVQNVGDLLAALRVTDGALPGAMSLQRDELMRTFAGCHEHTRSPMRVKADASRRKAVEMVNGGYDAQIDFSGNDPEMMALRDFYGIPNGSAGLASTAAQAALAVTAIKTGLSRTVSIRAAGGLDTHYNDWATDQGPRQRGGFNLIARMLEDLSTSQYQDTGDSWLDHTTIMAYSEFGRTAMINARGGRDHHICTAAILAGAGIRGHNIVGRSSDVGLMPMPVNLETGEYDQGGIVMRPEHALQTLFHSVGVTDDPADLRCDPIVAAMI